MFNRRMNRVFVASNILLWLLIVSVGGYVGIEYPAYKSAPVVAMSRDVSASVVRVYNESGYGSGVVIHVGDRDVVLTARHVAEHVSDGLQIQTQDGHTTRRVSGYVMDPNADVALLLIDPNDPFDANSPPLPFGEWDCIVGDDIILVGTPFDASLLNCVLPGHIVKVGAVLPDYPEWHDAIILDCHAEAGCSGGPILYRRKIVGIGVGRKSSLVVAIPVMENRLPPIPCGGK